MGNEKWMPVIDYEGLYEVSDFGRVRSLARNTTKGKILKPYINPNGYVYMCLCKDNNSKGIRLHRIVAGAFLGASNLHVNHIDGDKTNNTLSNLEYVTPSENMIHAYQTGLEVKKGREVICVNTGEKFKTINEASNYFGCHHEAIRRVCIGKRKSFRGLKFEFAQNGESL